MLTRLIRLTALALLLFVLGCKSSDDPAHAAASEPQATPQLQQPAPPPPPPPTPPPGTAPDERPRNTETRSAAPRRAKTLPARRPEDCKNGLFTAAKPGRPRTGVAIVRQRSVTVDFAKLRQTGPVRLNLFDDTCVIAIHNPKGSNQTTGVWVGTLEGEPNGSVTLVTKGDALVGTITSASGTYQVQYVGDGVHVVNQVDPSKYPNERPPTSPPKRPGGE